MDSQGAMTPEQSRDFLRRHLSEERASDDDLEALAERLGYQSLALKMAGQYFEQGFCPSVAEYEEKLDDAWNLSAMASWREKLSDPTAQELSCMAAFGLNWQQVEDETTRQVFLLAGYCMPHQPIPCRALDPAAKFRAKAPDAAINTLVGLGLLVTGDPKAGPIIHPSLAEYARAQEGADALLPYLTRSLDNLAYEFGERADTDLGPLLPHMRLVASRAAENGLGKAASLYGHLGAYSIRTGDYDGAREAYEWALKLEEQAGERDLGDMANYAKMRAVALRFLGNVEGVRAGFERAAALQSEWHAKVSAQ